MFGGEKVLTLRINTLLSNGTEDLLMDLVELISNIRKHKDFRFEVKVWKFKKCSSNVFC